MEVTGKEVEGKGQKIRHLISVYENRGETQQIKSKKQKMTNLRYWGRKKDIVKM